MGCEHGINAYERRLGFVFKTIRLERALTVSALTSLSVRSKSEVIVSMSNSFRHAKR